MKDFFLILKKDEVTYFSKEGKKGLESLRFEIWKISPQSYIFRSIFRIEKIEKICWKKSIFSILRKIDFFDSIPSPTFESVCGEEEGVSWYWILPRLLLCALLQKSGVESCVLAPALLSLEGIEMPFSWEGLRLPKSAAFMKYFTYSNVPNKRADPNKHAGWTIKKICYQFKDQIFFWQWVT